MATLEDVRRIALALPGAQELQDHGGNWFNVGKKTFVLYGFPSARWIFKLPKSRQEFLFEANPDVFQPYRAGAMLWSYVDVAALTPEEIKVYVTEAWTTIVPRKVSAPYLASLRQAGGV
jgi:hypothetical protein